MKRLSFVVYALVAISLFGLACRPKTDLNQKCALVKRNPDGGSPLPVLEGDVKALTGFNKDFIAFGTVECEDLVCVRDSNFQSGTREADGGFTPANPSDPAFGYCSRPCVEGSQCPSYDESLDRGPDALRCRALLLDKETLAALAAQGGSPGNVRDPFFCARGKTDGGM